MDQVKLSLFQLLTVLGALSPQQRAALARFERSDDDPLKQNLKQLIEAADEPSLEFLIRSSQSAMDDPRIQELARDSRFIQALTNAQVAAFGCVFRLLLLQETFYQCFTDEHLLQFLEMCRMPGIPADMQLQVLQHFQQLLSQLLPEKLTALHNTIAAAPDPVAEASRVIFELLEACQDQSLLNQPLARLLAAELPTALHVLQRLPQLQSVQLVQLVRLMQMENQWGILEIRQLLSPAHDGWQGLQALMGEGECASPDGEPDFSLCILEQPPDRIVYNRCLKPNPILVVNASRPPALPAGEALCVVPQLYRFDTNQPVAFLNGGSPLTAAVGAPVTFKRLKVTKTSHQLDDTLFYLRFELCRTDGHKQSNPMAFIHTRPFCVVSHSSLLDTSRAKGPAATVSEVVPPAGSTNGGTRVVILGAHFEESPSLLVAFGNLQVVPEYLSPGTLVCVTPTHFPAQVPVVVSNTGGAQPATNTQPGLYTFHDTQDDDAGSQQSLSVSTAAFTDADLDNFFATEGADLDLTQELLRSGFAPFSPLHFAAASGNVPILQRALDCHWLPVDLVDRTSRTPLHWAAYRGHHKVVALLLAAGANPNAQDAAGKTPLHLAVADGQVVHLLLEAGADPNRVITEGISPLHLACAAGAADSASLLLQGGAFLHQVDADGEGALHYAARSGDLAVAQLLLRAGAIVNQQNYSGEAPLHLAVSALPPSAAVMRLLLAQPHCNSALCDVSGATPLLLAVEAGMEEELLLPLLPATPSGDSFCSAALNASLIVAKQRNQPSLERLLTKVVSKPVQSGSPGLLPTGTPLWGPAAAQLV